MLTISIIHALALGYLYSSISLSLIHPNNARGVLAAGCLLSGMNELCDYAYEVCRRSITVETINTWVDFVEAIPPHHDNGSSPEPPRPASVFGLYAQKLRDQVFHFLVVTLPSVLGMNPPPSSDSPSPPDGRGMLLQIYSRVPFEIFKAALESPSFDIGR